VAVRIQMRRGTTSEWNSADPTLNEGEIGYNTTLGAFKVGDGSTIWSELDYYQTTASITPSEINAINISEKGAANGVAELDADKNVITASKIVFEGATADAYETYIQVGVEPAVADVTFTLPTTSGTIALASDIPSLAGYAQLSGATFTGAITGTTITLSGDIAVNGADITTTATSFNLINTTATTLNLGGAATVISIGSTSGTTTVNNNLTVTGDLTVNGTTTTIDTQTLQVEDKNVVLAYGNTSDVGADGGGITLLGTTNKTFTWVDATDAWTSSEHMNLASGKSYKVNNTAISAALPSLTWGEVKNGKSGLVIS
jgi:hypothetical protein